MSTRARCAIKVLAAILAVPGCSIIAPFDYDPMFDDVCFQNLHAPTGTPTGVIVFNPREADDPIAGRGMGFFSRGGWTFLGEGDFDDETIAADVQVDFGDDRPETVRVDALADGLRIEGLPGSPSTVELSDCRDTIGIYDREEESFFLWSALMRESPGISEAFEPGLAGGPLVPGPVAGDWDNDGTDSYGIYDPTTFTFHLAGDEEGEAVRTVELSSIPAGETAFPVAGDWNNDGFDSVGIYLSDLAEVHLVLNLDATRLVSPFELGPPGVAGTYPLAGDWDGESGDSVGLWSVSTGQFYLVNTNPPDSSETPTTCSPGVTFGVTLPLAGDWTARDKDDLALYHRESGSFLFYELDLDAGTCELLWEIQMPDAAFVTYLPIAGNWDGS